MPRRIARTAKSDASKSDASKSDASKPDAPKNGPAVPAIDRASLRGAVPISLRRNTISAQIHAMLRRDIIVGRLAPRVMLSEQDFATGFGVSRTPVREAMIKLAEEGLVEIFPQYGSFVAPIKLPDVFDSQFAREALECAAVDKAAGRLGKPQEAALKAAIRRQRALVRGQHRDEFFRADEDMHLLIFNIAGHETAWRFVESAKAQMDRVRHIAITMPRKQASILAEHEAVVDALLAGDRKAAVGAMRAHLRGIFRTIDVLRNENGAYFADGPDASGLPPTPAPAARPGRKYIGSNA
jgi:DNA-binding GntR family transcriptional regulator